MATISAEMNVQGAFELLVEALEEEVNGINHTGGAAFERGDYPVVDSMRARVDAITTLREKVLALRNEWEGIMPMPEDVSVVKEDSEPVYRRDLGRLPKVCARQIGNSSCPSFRRWYLWAARGAWLMCWISWPRP